MNIDEGVTRPSRTQMTNIQEVALFKFGLVYTSSSDSKIERLEIDYERLKQLPFFCALDTFMMEFFARNGVTHFQVSYVIWGGVATNLMLEIIGRTRFHYSLHDVELFLVRDGNIYQPESLIDVLTEDLSSDDHFLLEVGGQAIAKVREGLSVENFQTARIHLNDGDLYLNNVILIADRVKDTVFVEAPAGIFQALVAGADTLEVKDASNLRHIDRLARRIYRNISKAIRFEQVAGLTLSAAAKESLERLLDSYSNKLDEYFRGTVMPLEEMEITDKWIANAKIVSVESGKRWIYLMALSETAKRLAGLQGLSSLDQVGFCSFLLGEKPSASTLFEHPLIEIVRKCLADPAWPSRTAVRLDIAQRCYLDFSKYQRPGAEKLCEAYSLPSLALPL